MNSNGRGPSKVISITVVRSLFSNSSIGGLIHGCKVVIISRYRRVPTIGFRGVLGCTGTGCICKLSTAPSHRSKRRPVVFVRYKPVHCLMSTGSRTRSESFSRCVIPHFASLEVLGSNRGAVARVCTRVVTDSGQGGRVIASTAGTIGDNQAPVVVARQARRVRVLGSVLRNGYGGVVALVNGVSSGRGQRAVRELSRVSSDGRLVVVTDNGCVKRNFSCPELSALLLTVPVS